MVLSAKLLQRWPESVTKIARAEPLSLRPGIPHQLAQSAAASFKRVHSNAVVFSSKRQACAYICFS